MKIYSTSYFEVFKTQGPKKTASNFPEEMMSDVNQGFFLHGTQSIHAFMCMCMCVLPCVRVYMRVRVRVHVCVRGTDLQCLHTGLDDGGEDRLTLVGVREHVRDLLQQAARGIREG